MKKKLLQVLLIAAITSTGCQQTPKADMIVTNAVIWTGNNAQPTAAAMAIVNDTIAAIGTAEEMEKWKGEKTNIIDATGQFITPGFIDAHVHFITGGFQLASVQLRDAKTPAEFIQRIKAFAATIAPGTWILGGDWDHENWGGLLPQASWIDSITPNNPVFISRLDGHMGLANSAAMKLAAITSATAAVSGGTIVLDAGGNATGIFKDNAMGLVSKVIPNAAPEMEDKALQAAMQYVASNGVTTVHNMGDMGGDKDIAIFQRAHKTNQLITRAYVSMPLSEWNRLSYKISKEGRVE